MAQAAYNLEYFMPAEKPAPTRTTAPVKAVKAGKKNDERFAQFGKTLKTLLAAVFIVLLICGVLYTQTSVSELQSAIDASKSELVEAQAHYAYLNFELDNMTNMRAVEQRALELGMVKANSNQITYVSVEDDSEIQLREDPMNGLKQRFVEGIESIWENLTAGSDASDPQDASQQPEATSE